MPIEIIVAIGLAVAFSVSLTLTFSAKRQRAVKYGKNRYERLSR